MYGVRTARNRVSTVTTGRISEQEHERLRFLVEQIEVADPHKALGALTELVQRGRVLRDRIIREELTH